MNRMMHRTLLIAVAVGCVAQAVLLSNVSLAGPLATDPNALLKGTVNYTDTANGFTLNILVDYAVYAPGQFGTSAALGNPTDPSAGARYVYAYEAFNSALGTANLSSLSVGLRPNALAQNIGHTAANLVGSVVPNLSQFIGSPASSAKWSYTSTVMGPGAHSDVLLFTSPYAPTFIQAGVIGGHATLSPRPPLTEPQLPTPLPEPSTIALSVLGVVSLIAAKCARRGRKSA